jgi:hypothetical protein
MTLKEVMKGLAYWTIPPAIQKAAVQVWKRVRHPNTGSPDPDRDRVLALNHRWDDRHAGGQRCFIMASGPSIRQQDLKLLRGETCISVSNSFVHEDYPVFRPRYHCVPDIGGHTHITEADAVRWLGEMEKRTHDAVLFFSYRDRELIQAHGLFKDRQVHYVYFSGSWDRMDSDVDLTRALPGVQSVSVMAISLAVFMGFKRIYLLGCDHNWLNHFGTSQHFYESKDHAIMSRPNYDEWADTDVEEHLAIYKTLWGQYKKIRSLARARSIEIYNATPGSMLDVFPRVQYESLFGNAAVPIPVHPGVAPLKENAQDMSQ